MVGNRLIANAGQVVGDGRKLIAAGLASVCICLQPSTTIAVADSSYDTAAFATKDSAGKFNVFTAVFVAVERGEMCGTLSLSKMDNTFYHAYVKSAAAPEPISSNGSSLRSSVSDASRSTTAIAAVGFGAMITAAREMLQTLVFEIAK